MDHLEIDARSLALHRPIAARLRRDPSLLDSARSTLARWRVEPGRAETYLSEWTRILGLGVEATAAALEEESERADALRHCSPFTRILSPGERHVFLREWKARHAPR